MIGNDVIDLALASKQVVETNWFYKIFTDDEQLLIENSTNPELLFGIYQKRKPHTKFLIETGIRSFMPKQLECIYTNEILGLVLWHVTAIIHLKRRTKNA
jgi:hypothetical protein